MLQETILSALFDACCVRKTEKLLIGFSGGPDSVCLLDTLSGTGLDICIAYFDHQLRPESQQEVEFSHHMAEKYLIPVFNDSCDIEVVAQKEKQGIELTARKYRYQFLAQTAREIDAAAILVAHHADDQVETILMNLIRGCGMSGMLGMPYRTAHEYTGTIPVIRPMLGIWKSEILAYCKEKELPYCIDASNDGTDFTRNKVRNDIIPELMEVNPQVKENILRMRSILVEDDNFLEDFTRSAYNAVIKNADQWYTEVNVIEFSNLHTGIQRRLVKRLLGTCFSIEKDVRYQLIEDIRNVLAGKTRNYQVKINDEIRVIVENEAGYILRDESQISTTEALSLDEDRNEIAISIPDLTRINSNWLLRTERLEMPQTSFKISNHDSHQLKVYLDAEKIKHPITLRRKKPGDRYAPMGMHGHTMKVSDFWINKKIPKRLRSDYPLICDDEQVLWIPGFQPTENARISENTKSMIKITLERKNSASLRS